MAAARKRVSSIVRTAALAHCRAGKLASAPDLCRKRTLNVCVPSPSPSSVAGGQLSVPTPASPLAKTGHMYFRSRNSLHQFRVLLFRNRYQDRGLDRRFHQTLCRFRLSGCRLFAHVIGPPLIAYVALCNCTQLSNVSSCSPRSMSFLCSDTCSGVALTAFSQKSNNSRSISLSGTSRVTFFAPPRPRAFRHAALCSGLELKPSVWRPRDWASLALRCWRFLRSRTRTRPFAANQKSKNDVQSASTSPPGVNGEYGFRVRTLPGSRREFCFRVF